MPAATRRQRTTFDIWPGFVDAISALLIIFIFLLMVFTLAQFFLSETLSGRNEALARLNRQVIELTEMLSLEQSANADLRTDLSQVAAELQSSIAARDRISSQLAELLPERDALTVMLAQRTAERDKLDTRLAAAAARADKASLELENAFRSIEADKEKITVQLREIASLQRDLVALRKVRKDLEKNVAAMAATMKTGDAALTAARDRSKELVAALSSERERTALAQKDIEEKDIRLKQLLARSEGSDKALSRERTISATARKQVEMLNLQIAALRQQLARISAALEASEARAGEQRVQIVDLGRRLNRALAAKVEELARYRSEFFGRLREVLGERSDIRIVGDRFVFQSEVLFASGSAELADSGSRQIGRLATTLTEISRKIPRNLNWVLRVDGHTDRIPIATAKFPSNWELSTARATSVVKHLIDLGIPARRLAATGFGEFQPLDAHDDEVAYRRNRRIEFKLTER